jgi:hypothetical protein
VTLGIKGNYFSKKKLFGRDRPKMALAGGTLHKGDPGQKDYIKGLDQIRFHAAYEDTIPLSLAYEI